MHIRNKVIAFATLPLLAGCSDPTNQSGRLATFVGIPPLATLVERIGGDHVSVEVLVGPGQSPHTFSPSPHQAVRLSEARLYFAIGVEFERRLLPKLHGNGAALEIVDARAGVSLLPIDEDDEHAESAESHDDDAADPHVWLDPQRAKVIAMNIADALKRVDPRHSEDYDRNLSALRSDLDQLDTRIRAALDPYRGSEILVVHPAFGYFCDAYGLQQRAIHPHGATPGARSLQATIDEARAAGVQIIFYDPASGQAGARVIADALGAELQPLDPLPRDYFASLQQIADKIAVACKREHP